jgi:hypothetical protein
MTTVGLLQAWQSGRLRRCTYAVLWGVRSHSQVWVGVWCDRFALTISI